MFAEQSRKRPRDGAGGPEFKSVISDRSVAANARRYYMFNREAEDQGVTLPMFCKAKPDSLEENLMAAYTAQMGEESARVIEKALKEGLTKLSHNYHQYWMDHGFWKRRK